MSKKLDSITLELNLGIFKISGKWKPKESERKAAWELYVELVTRISVMELKKGHGLLTEALNSLYSIFSTTREILKKGGPDLARPQEGAEYSLGRLAINILNFELRPLLSEWHPLLLDYEIHKPINESIKSYEDKWEFNETLRKKLDETRKNLIKYAKYLALAAEVESIQDEIQEK